LEAAWKQNDEVMPRRSTGFGEIGARAKFGSLNAPEMIEYVSRYAPHAGPTTCSPHTRADFVTWSSGMNEKGHSVQRANR